MMPATATINAIIRANEKARRTGRFGRFIRALLSLSIADRGLILPETKGVEKSVPSTVPRRKEGTSFLDTAQPTIDA